jgi:hypothetical protein
MALERISQHVELGLLKIAPDYWGKPRISAVLAAVLREIQTLEDVIWDQFEAQHIDTANRARLAVMGKLIGQASPQGFSEEQYRTVLKARALANRSRGTGPEICRVLTALLGPQAFSWTWLGPAVIALTSLNGLSAAQVEMVHAVMPYATAAGVGIQLIYNSSDDLMLWGDPWGEAWGSEVTV